MPETNLPFGSEFSPAQIELVKLLEFCKTYEGKQEMLERIILETYFHNKGGGVADNQKKLAGNCRLSLRSYGIIDDECKLTEFGNELYSIKNDLNSLYDTLAKHILLNLNGMAFIQCIRDMQCANEKINLTTLHKACTERGLYYPNGGKHPSIMHVWLDKAGIFGHRWQLNDDKIKSLLGIDDEMELLRGLTSLQKVFLRSLLNTGNPEFQKASSIVKLAEATYSVEFPEKSLPKLVLYDLEKAGFITIERTTSGRGAKSPLVKPTEKANAEILIPFLEQIKKHVDPKLFELLQKSLSVILKELKSDNKYIAGLALEALAFKLMRIIGMEYVATRLRAEKTGGAEVDLIFESDRLVFSRWQIQCKNTKLVSLEDVAKEVGLTHLLKSNVIVMVSTGRISDATRNYSNSIMKESSLCIILIEKDDIERIAQDPTQIINIFNRQAKSIMALKKLSEEILNED